MKNKRTVRTKSTNYFNKYLETDIDSLVDKYRTQPDGYWRATGEKMTLWLFHEMASRVPAYKDFLKKHRITSKKIKNFKELSNVPLIDKSSYIDKYKVSDLCWNGKIANSYMISASSGSTGIPHFWPRSDEQTYHGALISEVIYKHCFQMDRKSTLYIDAFAMGMWIAGTYMMMSTEWVAQKGYPITIATPGLNKDEILRLVKLGKKSYEQILIIGYPPFIKDVIDTGIEQGINWKDTNLKFMFSGEAFTEHWRDYLQRKTGFKNILTDTSNIYGSADVGINAYETPTTIFLRRLAANNPKLLNQLFHAERVPSVNQFDPTLRYFEKVEEELIVSARSGIPLLRYNMKDIGGVLYFNDIDEALLKFKIDMRKDFVKLKLEHLIWKLPLVYLFGRGKFTAIIYGANIYPEHVKLAVENPRLENLLTGKFIITTEETRSHDQRLNLKVELKPGIKRSTELKQDIKKIFIEEIKTVNSEYRNNLNELRQKVYPHVILCDYGNPQYFPRGIVKKLA